MRVDAWTRCGLIAMFLATWHAAAQAADGIPSQGALREMGLADIRVMSDDEALAIRGQGAFAYGFSFAGVAGGGGIASSTNGYLSHGPNKAEGDNFSYAEVVKITKKQKKGDDKHGKKTGSKKIGGKKTGGKMPSGKMASNNKPGSKMPSNNKSSKWGGKPSKQGGYGGGKPMVWSLGVYSGGSSFSKL